MSHRVDGFELEYDTPRGGNWKAKRFLRGTLIDVVPVTWRAGCRRVSGDLYQQVWFRNDDEMEQVRLSRTPFVVAVAEAERRDAVGSEDERPQFKHFNALFEVVATGKQIDDWSIETRVLRRLRAP